MKMTAKLSTQVVNSLKQTYVLNTYKNYSYNPIANNFNNYTFIL